MSQLHAHMQFNLVRWRCQFHVRGFDPGDFETRDRIVLFEHFSIIGTAAIEEGEQPFFITHGSDQGERIRSGGGLSRASCASVTGGAARMENIAVSDDVERSVIEARRRISGLSEDSLKCGVQDQY